MVVIEKKQTCLTAIYSPALWESFILLKYKNIIPLLMDDGQCHRGTAFIFPDPDVRFLGNLLRSRIVRPKCLELACI